MCIKIFSIVVLFVVLGSFGVSYGRFSEVSDLRSSCYEVEIRESSVKSQDATLVLQAIEEGNVSCEVLMGIAKKKNPMIGRLAIKEYYKKVEGKDAALLSLINGTSEDRYLGIMILQELEPCDLGWEVLKKYSNRTVTRYGLNSEEYHVDLVLIDLMAYYFAYCSDSEPQLYARLYELEWGKIFRQSLLVKLCKYYKLNSNNEEFVRVVVMECIKREYSPESLENMLKYLDKIGWKKEAVDIKREELNAISAIIKEAGPDLNIQLKSKK